MIKKQQRTCSAPTAWQVGRFFFSFSFFFFESGQKIMERCDDGVMCRGKCSSKSTITPRWGLAVWFHVALSSCELCLDHSQCIIEYAQCSSCSGTHLTSNYGCMQQQKKRKEKKTCSQHRGEFTAGDFVVNTSWPLCVKLNNQGSAWLCTAE